MVKNVIAVGAHPDDVEFSCAGTLLKHIDEGDNVTILHMTNTGYKNTITGETLRSAKQSQDEAKKSAEIIGCGCIQLDFKEQEVPFNIESVTKNSAASDFAFPTKFRKIRQNHEKIIENRLKSNKILLKIN